MKPSPCSPSSPKPFLSYQILAYSARLALQLPADSLYASPPNASPLSSHVLFGVVSLEPKFAGEFSHEIKWLHWCYFLFLINVASPAGMPLIRHI